MDFDMLETKRIIELLHEQTKPQTEKVLGTLYELTNWMNSMQQSIDSIDKRLRLIEKNQNKSTFTIAKDEITTIYPICKNRAYVKEASKKVLDVRVHT